MFAERGSLSGPANRTPRDPHSAACLTSSSCLVRGAGRMTEPAAPFGGIKESGLGREGGLEGIDEYLEVKYLAVQA